MVMSTSSGIKGFRKSLAVLVAIDHYANGVQPSTPAERFIVVVGPSGIGKSRLVKAGLRLTSEPPYVFLLEKEITGLLKQSSLVSGSPMASFMRAKKRRTLEGLGWGSSAPQIYTQ